MTRAARLLVLALCIGYGISTMYLSATTGDNSDIGAYWNAALRLREGGPLYPPVADVNAPHVYRYAPWFAYAWIPLTHLPRWLVDAGWSMLLIGASIAVIVPALRTRHPAAIAFTAIVGGFLFFTASHGNVQPLMIAALVFGVERRSGPLWIAICASLKATPVLFAIVYAARGEWKRFFVTIGLTAILVVPMVFFDLGGYTTDPGFSHSLYFVSPLLFWIVAVISVIVATYMAWRHRAGAWLAMSVAVLLCLPRYFPYELTFLFVGLVPAVEGWRRRPAMAAAARA